MSKPSSTNYPYAFSSQNFHFFSVCLILFMLPGFNAPQIKALGDYSNGAPPLPIPNREVKLIRADGTAKAGE